MDKINAITQEVISITDFLDYLKSIGRKAYRHKYMACIKVNKSAWCDKRTVNEGKLFGKEICKITLAV